MKDQNRLLFEMMLAVDTRIRQALLQYARGAGSVPSLISGLATYAGDLIANARVGVRKNSGGSTYKRRRLNLVEGSNVTLTVADDSDNEEVDVTIAAAGGGGGGGITYGQTVDYPDAFSGDVINGSSTSPFADVSAFDTKEVLNSRILHLVTLGASKDQRVRVTLGTTKSGAFDVRFCIMLGLEWYWSNSAGDYYAEIRLSTAADAQLAIVRIIPFRSGGGSGTYVQTLKIRVGGTAISSTDDTVEPALAIATPMTFRITRDGSDNLAFYMGVGTAPMALARIVDGYHEPYDPTASGTLARIEVAHHTPVGPGGAAIFESFVDYVGSFVP